MRPVIGDEALHVDGPPQHPRPSPPMSTHTSILWPCRCKIRDSLPSSDVASAIMEYLMRKSSAINLSCSCTVHVRSVRTSTASTHQYVFSPVVREADHQLDERRRRSPGQRPRPWPPHTSTAGTCHPPPPPPTI
uniref:Uncharacterized protein n=1 Tax=Setaria viridis TaxID=4556 RepID=A0A4U6TPJ3_SETVI|nr:hypothetical protein SEVIR_8G247900v2 [Setaria viridis]